MILRNKKLGVPAAGAALSLVLILPIMSLTSPINNISFAIVFFVLLLIFLTSLGYLVIRLQFGEVSPKARYRIVIISGLILLAIMLRSLQSLNVVDLLIVGLISFGMLFYSSRRS